MGLSLYVYEVDMTRELEESAERWRPFHWWNKCVFDTANISYSSFSKAMNYLRAYNIKLYEHTCNPFPVVANWCVSKKAVPKFYKKIKTFENGLKLDPNESEENEALWTLGRIVEAFRIATERNGWIRAS